MEGCVIYKSYLGLKCIGERISQDADLMLAAIKPYMPQVVQEYRRLTEDQGLKRLGTNGVNMYYCSEYMAPIHPDNDQGISLCCQLDKFGCPDGVLDFVYAYYGLYIQTRSNMAWYVHIKKFVWL